MGDSNNDKTANPVVFFDIAIGGTYLRDLSFYDMRHGSLSFSPLSHI